MYNTFKISIFFLLFVITFLPFSCIKEEFDPDKLNTDIVINPSVAAPIGYIHYELDELLRDSSKSWDMIIDEDGLISFFYEANITSQPASEILQFPPVTESGYFRNVDTLPLDLNEINPTNPFIQILYDTVQFVLTGPDGPDYTDIDSIQAESMTVIVYLTPHYPLEGEMIISSAETGPGIYKTNSTGGRYGWSESFPVSADYQTIIVEDFTIIPFNDSKGNNRVPLIFEMRLTSSNAIVPAGDDILNYIITIQDLDYSAIYGYLGKFNYRIEPQTLPIEFYNSINGAFHFEQPRLNLYFENSFGLPVQIIMTDLYTTSPDGNLTDITGSSVPSEDNIQVIDYPTLAEFGKSAYDSLIIHYDDANLFAALETSPSTMTFGIEARTNTFENDTDNFITDQSQLDVRAKLILPLYGNSELMIVEDSLLFNFDDFFNNPPEEIKKLTLRLNFTNGFPVNISTQVYFADENYSIVDSVFEKRYLIEAGMDTNGDGKVDEPRHVGPVEAELSRSEIDTIANTRYIILNGRLATANFEIPENFKFYSYYFLDAYIGVLGDLELNSTHY